MPGRDDLNERTRDASLAAALRALAESAPQPDLWPELARSIAQPRAKRRWRYALPAAIAAALAIALLVPRTKTRDIAPAPGTPVVATSAPATSAEATATDELAQLHQRSQSLERWIAAVAARAPQDGRDLMAAVEVEDLIGLVDVQLGGARGEADALPLWRQRVALLEDLATIRGTGLALAERGDGAAWPSLNLLN